MNNANDTSVYEFEVKGGFDIKNNLQLRENIKMDIIDAIIKTVLYLNLVNDKDNFIPDLYLHKVSKNYGLSVKDCRKIRDIIQINALEVEEELDKTRYSWYSSFNN